MLESYLSAAVRHLINDYAYALLKVVGLGLGFSAALLIALFVRDELSFDRFIPRVSELYAIYTVFDEPGRPPLVCDATSGDLAEPLRLDMPQIAALAQLLPSPTSEFLKRDTLLFQEPLYWADANLFAVIALPVLAGDAMGGLQRPDGLVLTRRLARKYFGTDAPIGRTLEIVSPDHSPVSMTVTAVLQDFPSSTNLAAEAFASGRSAASGLKDVDTPYPGFSCPVNMLVRLAPGASAEALQRELPGFLNRHKSDPAVHSGQIRITLHRFTDVHLTPSEITRFRSPGDRNLLYALGAVGILILLAATINFVNLITARAAERAVEIGVRKAAGASQWDLFIQFMGESLLYAVLGMSLALALCELALPRLNAFLDRHILLQWSDSALLAVSVALILVVGFLGGAYPALVLSRLRPVATLKKGLVLSAGSEWVRQALVIVQFATLIGLIIITGVIYRQTQFALNEATRIDKEQVWVVGSDHGDTRAHEAFVDTVGRLPGVVNVTRSSPFALDFMQSSAPVLLGQGMSLEMCHASVAAGFFEFYGLRPVAGRLFSADHPSDFAHVDAEGYWNAALVINERAAHLMGFASARAAVGKTVRVTAFPPEPPRPSLIIGVVPDFELESLHNAVCPTVFYVSDGENPFYSVRLNGQRISETLRTLDGLGQRILGGTVPPTRVYLDDRLRELNLDIVKEGQLFAVFAALAMFIACLGLLGLSAFTAERRTKEIGVRKAMGATTPDIVKLLMLQFVKPVLFGTLVAWPLAAVLMGYWLRGFANHLPLEPILFVIASIFAVCIAGLTVMTHCLRVAHAKPVDALRYE